ncbi:fimbrial assembly protein fimC [Vagococcus sp. BWB3-3]|uniref:Fimbrial assembly protein fimC n=1 Tax=Vagococcus allomyrinae TaxID=2794353 RepID=A0A940SX46_9ENTE|nr:TraX family protein [Vagococcus allomyrinae]MBP1041998.1 fimbrial assembly protein fimC [Vagococcus allomyrinae]
MTKELDGFQLKLIAIIAMLLNHIGSVFQLGEDYPAVYWLTETIGKLTFPIMAYLLVQGFHYTGNRLRYGLRLAVFWLLSIIPFHVAFYNNWNFSWLDLFNNILFTLLVGLIMMVLYEKTTNSVLRLLIVLGSMSMTITSDWSLVGILIIFGYYQITDPKRKIISPPLYVAIPTFLISVGLGNRGLEGVLAASPILGLLLTIPVLFRYNGQRGYSPNWVKWGYYAFYPSHLFLLYLIKLALG